MWKLCIGALIATTLLADDCEWGYASNVVARHREGKGIGYQDGYTTLGAFLTPNWDRNVQPFADLRGHLSNSGEWSSNAGLGARFHLPSRWVLGGNFYYDFRDNDELRVHQISGGFEALRNIYEVRLNGYYPLGSPRESQKTSQHVKAIMALPTIFGECGIHIPTFDWLNLYLGTGPYYIVERTISDVDCGGSIGALVRLKLRIYDGIDLEGTGTFDGTYHAIAQGCITLSFPLGPAKLVKKGSRWNRWFPTAECKAQARERARMQQAALHNEIIPLCKRSKKR